MTSTEGSVGPAAPPPSISPDDDITDSEGEGGYEDFEDNRRDNHGLPDLFIPPLSFPGCIEIPGLELARMDSDTPSEPRRSPTSPRPPSPTAEKDRPTTATSTRTSGDPHISTPPSEGSNQPQTPDYPGASERTEVYTVLPKSATDEAKASAGFLRTLSLVPLRNILHVSRLEGLFLYWNVVLTADQALKLLDDPNIGAVMPPQELPYDPFD